MPDDSPGHRKTLIATGLTLLLVVTCFSLLQGKAKLKRKGLNISRVIICKHLRAKHLKWRSTCTRVQKNIDRDWSNVVFSDDWKRESGIITLDWPSQSPDTHDAFCPLFYPCTSTFTIITPEPLHRRSTGRLARWALSLLEYNFETVHQERN